MVSTLHWRASAQRFSLFFEFRVPSHHPVRPKKKDSCVQVSEVKKIRVGRSKNIFILDFFLLQMHRGFNRRQGSGGQLL